jgi:diadenylate cyclase
VNEVLALFEQMRWEDLVDICLVAFVIYQVILLVKGTRAVQMILGLGVIFAALVVSQRFNLLTINWIINNFLSSFILVVIILFQSEIRRALSRMGRGALFTGHAEAASTLDEVVRAAMGLASRMMGGLIVLERRVGLTDYVEVGASLDAEVSRELLLSLFQPPGPLHDGAVIIADNRIRAARCLLPLSTNPNLGRHLGTRHRAALGLAEETDAVCVVVSEERGRISVAAEGGLTPDLDAPALRNLLFEYLQIQETKRRRFPWRRPGRA